MYGLWYVLGECLIDQGTWNRVTGLVEKKVANPPNPSHKDLGVVTTKEGHRCILSRYEVGEVNRMMTDHVDRMKQLADSIGDYLSSTRKEKALDGAALKWTDDMIAVLGICLMDHILRNEIMSQNTYEPFVIPDEYREFMINLFVFPTKNEEGGERSVNLDDDGRIAGLMDTIDKEAWFSPCKTGHTNALDYRDREPYSLTIVYRHQA